MTWQSALSHASVTIIPAQSIQLATGAASWSKASSLLCLLLHRHLLLAGWTPVEYPVWKEGRYWAGVL
jgi:hypothetical protein